MERITSLKNPKVQGWKALKERKGRRESGCFLVEGFKMVEEALTSAFTVEAVLAQEERLEELALRPECPVYLLPAGVLAAVCDTKTPQGVAAVVRMAQRPAKGGRLIALDGVQDPGNVGTILRTADAAGLDGAILSEQCADVFGPKTLRATMGSVFRVPVTVTDDLPGYLRGLRTQGYSVLSSQLDGEPFYRRGDVGKRFCLVIGSEGNGVSDGVKAEATHRLKLPMRGGAESLNAAVAAGIMMYDLMKDE